MRQSGTGNIFQRVFFAAIDSHVIVAAHTWVDELDDDLLADTLKIAIPPLFKRISRSLAATFFHRTLIRAARRM